MKFGVSHIVWLRFSFALWLHYNYLHLGHQDSHKILDILSECEDFETGSSRNRTYGLINASGVITQESTGFRVIGRFTSRQISHPADLIKESLLFMLLKTYSIMVDLVSAPKSYHQPSHPGEVLEQEGPHITTRIRCDIFKKG